MQQQFDVLLKFSRTIMIYRINSYILKNDMYKFLLSLPTFMPGPPGYPVAPLIPKGPLKQLNHEELES